MLVSVNIRERPCVLTEMVFYELLILESMLGTNRHDGPVGAEGAVCGLAGRGAPCHLLLKHME